LGRRNKLLGQDRQWPRKEGKSVCARTGRGLERVGTVSRPGQVVAWEGMDRYTGQYRQLLWREGQVFKPGQAVVWGGRARCLGQDRQ